MRAKQAAILLPTLLLLMAVLACNPPPKATPPFTHADFPPEAYVDDPDAMVRIPAGEFSMGCDPANDLTCDAAERPLHRVYLDTYAIGKYEVTNARYQACVEAGGCTPPADTDVEGRTPYYGNPDYALFPVVSVTWQQAGTFCAWVDMRLPSEAEWEKAARGSDDTRKFAWDNLAGGYDCSYPTYTKPVRYDAADPVYCINGTSPVGSHPRASSPYGVMDLPGNVQEWVNDWYGADYYAASPEANPAGPESGELRSVRGGDYFELPVVPHQIVNVMMHDHISSLRVSWRAARVPTYAEARLGFRCADSVE